jgi:hypothetical protein
LCKGQIGRVERAPGNGRCHTKHADASEPPQGIGPTHATSGLEQGLPPAEPNAERLDEERVTMAEKRLVLRIAHPLGDGGEVEGVQADGQSMLPGETSVENAVVLAANN